MMNGIYLRMKFNNAHENCSHLDLHADILNFDGSPATTLHFM